MNFKLDLTLALSATQTEPLSMYNEATERQPAAIRSSKVRWKRKPKYWLFYYPKQGTKRIKCLFAVRKETRSIGSKNISHIIRPYSDGTW